MPKRGLESFAQRTGVVAQETPSFAVISPVGDTSKDAHSFGGVDLRQEGIEGFHKERQGFEYLMWDRSGSALARDMTRKLKSILKRARFSGDDIGLSWNAFFHRQDVAMRGIVHMCPTD